MASHHKQTTFDLTTLPSSKPSHRVLPFGWKFLSISCSFTHLTFSSFMNQLRGFFPQAAFPDNGSLDQLFILPSHPENIPISRTQCILLMVKICFLIVKQQTQGDLFPVQFLLRSIFLSLLHIVATFSGGFRHWQKIALKAAPAGQQRRALPDLPSDA